ncbi:MAG: preprotein translocase subunit SecG [Alphaproteobacteria bacterium]
MQNILMAIHALVALALVGVVLMQRSEGGALGIGGGSGGGMMSARGKASFLTRLTSALAAAFMVITLILAMIASDSRAPQSILDRNQDLINSAPVQNNAQENVAVPAETPASAPAIPVEN